MTQESHRRHPLPVIPGNIVYWLQGIDKAISVSDLCALSNAANGDFIIRSLETDGTIMVESSRQGIGKIHDVIENYKKNKAPRTEVVNINATATATTTLANNS